jgi:hypothetical protein
MPADATIRTTPVGQHARGVPEPSRVDARNLFRMALGVVIFLGLAITALHAIFSHEVPIDTVPPPRQFQQPRVQPNEGAELRQLLANQHQKLTAYRWADSAHTLVQIPIDRAMQIVAQKGPRAYDPIASIAGALASPEAGAERAMTPAAGHPAGTSP